MKIGSAGLWRQLLLVVLAAGWLASLGARPLYKPDEARYGEIAREMAQSGDWLTPRLNGFKYFEKPPLQYWASAAALKVFGEHDWSVRLWSGVMALFGVGLTFYAGRRLFSPRAGALAALVLASCPLYVALGQISTLDMGVAVFLSAAVFAFAIAQSASEAHAARRWILVAWAACGLAVLSKGLIGIVLPAASVALYVLLRRDWALLARLEPVRGAALFLAIAAPWFIAVSLRNSEFARFFFVQEHWQRFTTTMHHREHPVWYFLPVLAAGVFPWLLAVVAGWARAARGLRGGPFSPELFLGLWALVVLVFFSLSGSKLPPYILPMLPALAALTGAYLAGEPRRGLLAAQCLLVAAAGVFLVLGGGRLEALVERNPGLAAFAGAYRPWFAAAAASLLAAGALGAAAVSAERRHAAVACIAAGSLAAALLALVGHRVFAPAFSASELAAAALRSGGKEAKFYTVETYDHSIPWSLRRTVTMVGYKDELSAAIDWDAERFLPDLESFRRAWSAEPKAYAFFALRDFDGLSEKLGLPLQEVARSTRYVLVRKP
jgi:4-amino-4-deoxy-L-arabinose transferase-like glycosyltransferase